MDKYTKLMKKFRNKEPFALARFNDGEMSGIEEEGAIVARGDQQVDSSLQLHLERALSHRQEDYWIGKPCSLCFPSNRETYDSMVPSDYPYQTHATVLINNGRWWLTFECITKGVGNRDVIWIGGESQDISEFERRGLDITQIEVPEQNGWRMYDELRDKTFPPGSVVMLSCGPLSRVLTCDYYQNNPEVTVLDLGSVFDPITRDVWFRCHTHNGKYCGGQPCEEDNYDTDDLRLVGRSRDDILMAIKQEKL